MTARPTGGESQVRSSLKAAISDKTESPRGQHDHHLQPQLATIKVHFYPAPVTLESILAPEVLVGLLTVSKRFIKRLEGAGLRPVVMAGCSPRYRYGDVLEAMRAKAKKTTKGQAK